MDGVVNMDHVSLPGEMNYYLKINEFIQINTFIIYQSCYLNRMLSINANKNYLFYREHDKKGGFPFYKKGAIV